MKKTRGSRGAKIDRFVFRPGALVEVRVAQAKPRADPNFYLLPAPAVKVRAGRVVFFWLGRFPPFAGLFPGPDFVLAESVPESILRASVSIIFVFFSTGPSLSLEVAGRHLGAKAATPRIKA